MTRSPSFRDGFVDRLSGFSFLPPYYPSYRALASTLARLSSLNAPAFCWTHLHAGLSRRTSISITLKNPCSLVQSLAAESCGSCLRRGQARRHLTENLFVVSSYRPLHMDTSALHACFLRQSLELSLKKDFQLFRCQEGNGNSSGLPCRGLDSHAVWGFGRLRFWSHAIHPFSGATKAAGKLLAF
jgi:hypothetical protein